MQLVNMWSRSVGDTLAVGQIVERGDDAPTVVRALRADGAATVVSGALASFPIVTFGQSVGLVSVTRVRSRHVVALSGALMVLLAFVPVLGAAVAAVPGPVLGGVSLVMFGTVGACGPAHPGPRRPHRRAEPADRRARLRARRLIVGAPEFYAPLPPPPAPSWTAASPSPGIVAFALNLLFTTRPASGRNRSDDARHDHRRHRVRRGRVACRTGRPSRSAAASTVLVPKGELPHGRQVLDGAGGASHPVS
ncbi:solute carrier family 23 protein [Streptomyces sp. KL116D]|uniref:solute carrier family 23 protein n=1 Tax=Streptomyces sp. KL116D TaxID=3045152 RepID=UPI0035586B8F